MPKKFLILIFIIIIFVSLFSIIISLTTDLSLGDEVYHYRFAENWFWLGRRPVVDVLYENSNQPAIVYGHDILWNFILAKIWKIFGHISFMAAQIYHTFYYILLIFLTYLLGKKLYDTETGLYSALLAATVPMIAVFGILFYTDVPGAVFSVLCVLFLIKRRYFSSGIALGLMYLSKRSTLLFFPALLFIIFYYNKGNFKIKFRNLLLFIFASAIIILPDLYWREMNFKRFPPNIFTSYKAILNNLIFAFKANPFYFVMGTGDMRTFTNILNNDFAFVKYFQQVIWISYFGIGIFIALLFYFIYRKGKKKDIILWTLVGSYILFYFVFLRLSNEVRYMLPIIPFLSILVAIPIASTNKRFLKNIIIFICTLQLFVTVGYVSTKRRIPRALKEGFTYIRENTSPEVNILYLEYIGLEMMNRRIKWSGDANILNKIFCSSDAAEVSSAMNEMDIDYIFIRKSRIYDDSNLYYVGGYPKSFVDRLPNMLFIKLVYENSEVSIWKVNRNK